MALHDSAGPAWDDGQWSALPPLHGELRAEVCVLGLGGSGLTAIETLCDRGMNVVGIDAAAIAAGAAGRNGGFLLAGLARFHHEMVALLGRSRAAALYRHTVEEIARIESGAGAQVRHHGSLRIAMDPAEMSDCDLHFAALRADDLPVERYDGPEGRGLLLPTDAAFNPLTRCRSMASGAMARGAKLFENTQARHVQQGCVTTPAGRILADQVIVAVDGKLETVLPEMQGRVRTARLQMLGTAPTREIELPRPVYARYGYDYWQQTADHRVVLGGFRDTQLETEWTTSTDITAGIQQQLEYQLRERLGVQAPITHRWAASVGYTPEGMPILERVRPGIWAIGGYNGTGNIVGALCARAVVDLIVSGRSAFATLLTGNG